MRTLKGFEPSYWSSSIAGIAFGRHRFLLQSLALSPCSQPLLPNHVSAHRCFTQPIPDNSRLCQFTRAHDRRSRCPIRANVRGSARELRHAKFRKVHVARKPLQVAGGQVRPCPGPSLPSSPSFPSALSSRILAFAPPSPPPISSPPCPLCPKRIPISLVLASPPLSDLSLPRSPPWLAVRAPGL